MKKHVMRNNRRRGLSLPLSVENSKNPKVSVIIPAMNEQRTIAHVIHEARNVHPDTEVIVIVNGSKDATQMLAEQMGARVIHYPEQLGYAVGRMIGALEAKGDILLFTDADILISAEKMIPFVVAIEQGADIALKGYPGTIHKKFVHHVILSKKVLNTLLSVSHLGAASMTAIPHAISRKAFEVIGAENLAIPPKAQAIAVKNGLRVVIVPNVNVGKANSRRERIVREKVKKMIIGDHLEAIYWLVKQTSNNRADYTDLGRARERVKDS